MLSGDKSFLAQVDACTTARPGQEVELVFNMANMHAFDPETQVTLLGGMGSNTSGGLISNSSGL